MKRFRGCTCLLFTLGLGLVSMFGASPSAGARVEIAGAVQPQLTTDARGRVWLAYARAKDVYVARSDDGGRTFGAEVKVTTQPRLMVGMRRGPRIAAQGDAVTVTLIADELLAFHSPDGGKTWGGPTVINSVPSSAREGLHDLAASPTGERFVTWLDLRNGKMELWGAASSDGGRSWKSNTPVYRSPDKAICECCHPTAVFDAEGNLAVMWRNSIAGARDMWSAVRAKGTKAFSAPRRLGTESWTLNACPMDGGKLVAYGKGAFGSVWQRAGDVVFAPADSGAEIKLGRGRQPVAIARGDETLVCWQQGADLVSLRMRPGPGEPEKRAENARFPVLIGVENGRGALLAYEQGPPKGITSVVVERW